MRVCATKRSWHRSVLEAETLSYAFFRLFLGAPLAKVATVLWLAAVIAATVIFWDFDVTYFRYLEI